MQPFFVYIPGGGWSFVINSETTYDWTGEQFIIPINLRVAGLLVEWHTGSTEVGSPKLADRERPRDSRPRADQDKSLAVGPGQGCCEPRTDIIDR